jgi:hypothetical protein
VAAFGRVKTVLNSRRARLIQQPRQPGKSIEAEFSDKTRRSSVSLI